jgi:DNA-binding response OmpR family regulator
MMESIYDKKIILVDDDQGILTMLETLLEKEGYHNLVTCSSGKEIIEALNSFTPDIIVLDIMLPDMDGFQICTEIRKHSMVPILFLSAKSDESDKLISYAVGGDDFIGKPFSPKELLAKIKNILLRQEYYTKHSDYQNSFKFGNNIFDSNKKMLFQNGQELPLTAKEYLLLEYFIQNRNITLSKEEILKSVWGTNFDGYDNTVMVHIRKLREKIEKDPSNPHFLKTIKGRGYIFAHEKENN